LQVLFRLWECAKRQLTAERLHSKLFDYTEIIGKDCLACGSRKGQTRGKYLIVRVDK
jgi:hypothetical protein